MGIAKLCLTLGVATLALKAAERLSAAGLRGMRVSQNILLEMARGPVKTPGAEPVPSIIYDSRMFKRFSGTSQITNVEPWAWSSTLRPQG